MVHCCWQDRAKESMTATRAVSALTRAFPPSTRALLAAPPALIEFLPVAILCLRRSVRIRCTKQAAEWADRRHGEKRNLLDGPQPGLWARRRPASRRRDSDALPCDRRSRAANGDDRSARRLASCRDGARHRPRCDWSANRRRHQSFHDVTEHLARIAPRATASASSRDISTALPVALYTTDAEGRITYYNDAAVEMSGGARCSARQMCVTWKLFWPAGTALAHDECPMAVR